MRQAADILSSAPAMQIRYLEAMQAMAKSANSKVIFLPSASTVGSQMQAMVGDSSSQHNGAGGLSASQKYDNDFGGQGSDFQRAINAHVVENI
jgi:type IV secretory pathway TrbL component